MHRSRVWRNLAIAALGLFFAQLPSTAQVKPLYHGAAHLFSLADATVVYPAGSGDETEVNRLSAERRALFLRSVYRMQVEVSADDAVSPEQLQGNLLLLGWENRLLPDDEATRPIVKIDDGYRFLDEIRVGPGDDLMFGWGSPYNPRRFLVFWSRIDLELDRFMTLPFVASDWAVYRDFKVLGQGVFDTADEQWPPKRYVYGESPMTEPPRLATGRSSAHYRLHHYPDALDEAAARRILAARESAWEHAVKGLGGEPEGFRIELFVYRNQAEMAQTSGVRDMAVYSIPARRELHMILELAELDNPHEDLHVLARELLGPAIVSTVFEGLAVSLEQGGTDSELGMQAAAMVEQNRVPTIADLLDEERHSVLVKNGVGLPAAGLFVTWLKAKTGDESFRRLYTRRDLPPAELAAVLDMDTAAMEQAFSTWLKARAQAASADYAHSKMLTEARRRGAAGDRQGELATLAQALELRPDDPETLYLTSLAQLRGSEFATAEQTLKRLLRVTGEDPGTTTHVLGVYRLGQTLERLGRPGEALERFESMLALPDMHDSHRLAREAIEKIKNANTGD